MNRWVDLNSAGIIKIGRDGTGKVIYLIPPDTVTADVRENVHGEWIPGKELSREMCAGKVLHIEYENYKCSACGLTLDRLLYHIDGSPFYKFCPNCGADMRKEEMSE